MFTISQARSAIANSAYFARGRAYVEDGRVGRIEISVHGGEVEYSAPVRGHGARYNAGFVYNEEDEDFVSCTCDCPAFVRSEFGCKHVAAVMIAACSGAEQKKADDRRARREAQMRALQQMMMREREQEQERMRAAQQARMDQAIARMIEDAAKKPAQQDGEKTSLFPILSLYENGVGFELRIGRRRPYVVRSLSDFAMRIEAREAMVYGKELTFSHLEEDVAEQDRALFWHIALLAGCAPEVKSAMLYLTGVNLDRTMRLLIGRDVDVRRADGSLARMHVEEGAAPVPVSLAQSGAQTTLTVGSMRAAAGCAGAYFFMEEKGKIICAQGAAYGRIGGLMALAREYPDGVTLSRQQLLAVCARVIAPARKEAAVCVTGGQAIVEANTPMTASARFRVDMEEANRLTCQTEFVYEGKTVYPHQTGDETPDVRRDAYAEEEGMQAARALFPEEVRPGQYAFEGDDDACFELLSERLPALSASGEVLVAERLTRMNVQAKRNMTLGMSVSGGELIVKGDLGGYSHEELLAAYAAYRQKRKYVRLSDGTFLSGEALEQAADTAQMLESVDLTAEQVEQGAGLSQARALYIEEALKAREEIRLCAPREITGFAEKLRQAQQVRAEQPKTLACQLRGYQLTGLSWLCALSGAGFGGILADDMGLGKTVQALAMMLCAQEKGETVRALVVCPASLQLNWQSEAQRFAPSLSSCALLGGAAERQKRIQENPPELTIASYDQVRRDAALYKGVRFTHILLDEAQNIKNAASQAAKAVKTLTADHRFAMTGTPVENRLSELWSIFDFLMPGYLQSYKKFKERFEAPVVKDADEKARKNLRMMVAPFILRRMKRDVLDDLPEKVETVLTSEMTADQRKLYAAYAARLMDESEGGFADAQSRMKMLAGLTRLRQLCCDPRLCVEDYAGGSGKLDQCLELVKDSVEAGHRILLFSQFTAMLALLKKALSDAGYEVLVLTGETGKRERMQLANSFNEGRGNVFLISLKAGGTGLNLTGADVVIHYDPWWNTSAQNQATDRAYRIGQVRGVQVFSLIASDSVEERILRLQQAKRELSDGVLEGDENLFTLDAEAFKKILRG